MVPRADIVAVEEKTPLAELVKAFREAQHSRLPVYRETLDDPLGLRPHQGRSCALRADARRHIALAGKSPPRKIKRDLVFVPPSMPARDLLLKMQTTHIHWRWSIDEYGGTDGLVSIEDLVEEIVGDIDDEHDVEQGPNLRSMPDGDYEADARLDLEDFKARTGIDLAPGGFVEKKSIRWAAWSSRWSAECRSAARSSRIRPATNSKSSKPIRAASSASICGRPTKAPKRNP